MKNSLLIAKSIKAFAKLFVSFIFLNLILINSTFSQDYGLESTIGNSGVLSNPNGIAINNDELFVVESPQPVATLTKIKVFSVSGLYLRAITLTSAISNPKIAIDANKIYITNNDIPRIEVYSINGSFLAYYTVAGKGTGFGQLNQPTGISIFENKIYVTDSYSEAPIWTTTKAKISVISINGQFLSTITSSFATVQPFRPKGIKVIDNKIYVSDVANGIVQILSTSGTYLNSFNASLSSGGLGYMNDKIFVGGAVYSTNGTNLGLFRNLTASSAPFIDVAIANGKVYTLQLAQPQDPFGNASIWNLILPPVVDTYNLGNPLSSTCDVKSVTVPINIASAVSSVIGFDISIPFDASKLAINTVTSGNLLMLAGIAYDISYSINTTSGTKLLIGISGNNVNGAGLVQGLGTLVNIVFDIKPVGLFNYSFTGANLIESYSTNSQLKNITGTSLYVIVNTKAPLSGDISYLASSNSLYNNGSAKVVLSQAAISNGQCTSGLFISSLTGVNSGFGFINILTNTGISILRNFPDNNAVSNVINAFDAVVVTKIRQGTANYASPTFYQLEAADVNNDGRVTSGDRTQILRRSVKLITTFENNTPDWKFSQNIATYGAYDKDNVPAISSCFPIAYSTISGCISINALTATGILTGDVDGNYNYSVDGSSLRLEASNDEVIYDLSAATKLGNSYSIPVIVNSSDVVEAVDLSLDYNQSKASIGKVALSEVNSAELVYNDYQNDILLVAAVTDPTSRSNKFINIELATNEILNEKLFDGYSSYINGKNVATTFRTDATTGLTDFLKKQIKVSPNPSNGSIIIKGIISNTNYIVLDALGKKVAEGSISPENANISLDLSAGVYTLVVENAVAVRLIMY